MEEKKIINILKERFKDKIKETSTQYGDETLVIGPDSLLEIMTFLKNKPYEYNLLLDLTCTDYLGQEPRFEMVYHLFSLTKNHRLH